MQYVILAPGSSSVLAGQPPCSLRHPNPHDQGYLQSSQPTILAIQEGFVWPHLVISPSLLDDLDIKGRPAIFSPSLTVWTTIKPGHVIVVNEGDQIFIKESALHDLQGFGDFRVKAFESRPLHFRNNLPPPAPAPLPLPPPPRPPRHLPDNLAS
ncbi:hypothetical protein ONZ45_g12703 [Pleurotus djamor]|nr:hypothetical protein ONZ45_g12703 [Pleurotus djamor]